MLYDELDDEARLQRPGAIERFTYETLASIAGPALVRGLDHIVPVEAVADSDEQVFAARPPRSAGLVVRPEAHVVSLDALADHPSVTSVVTSTDVRARRPLPSVSELLLVGISRNPLPDAETQANLPSLDSLFASWAWGDRNLELSRHQAGSMRRMAIPRGLLPVDRGIGALTDFVALEELKLKNCLPAESLSPLAELTELRSLVADAGGGWLTLAACTRLEDVAAFNLFPSKIASLASNAHQLLDPRIVRLHLVVRHAPILKRVILRQFLRAVSCDRLGIQLEAIRL